MKAFVIIGEVQSELGPVAENIYTGPDGVAADAAAAKAARSGRFTRIGKIVNPMTTPLPVDPSPTKASGAPKLPSRGHKAPAGKVPPRAPQVRQTPPPPAPVAPEPEPEPVAIISSEVQ